MPTDDRALSWAYAWIAAVVVQRDMCSAWCLTLPKLRAELAALAVSRMPGDVPADVSEVVEADFGGDAPEAFWTAVRAVLMRSLPALSAITEWRMADTEIPITPTRVCVVATDAPGERFRWGDPDLNPIRFELEYVGNGCWQVAGVGPGWPDYTPERQDR